MIHGMRHDGMMEEEADMSDDMDGMIDEELDALAEMDYQDDEDMEDPEGDMDMERAWKTQRVMRWAWRWIWKVQPQPVV